MTSSVITPNYESGQSSKFLMVVSAPLPIVLFGDQQDLLGLPMITASISNHVTINATPLKARFFRIIFPEQDEYIEIDPEIPHSHPGVFERAVIMLKELGVNWPGGFGAVVQTTFSSEDPGLRAATIAAWIRLLISHSTNQIRPKSNDIASLFASSQTGSTQTGLTLTALSGGIFWIDFSPRLLVSRIEGTVPSLLLVATRRGKLSPEIAERSRKDTIEGMARISEKIDGFDIAQTAIGVVEHRIQAVAPEPARRLTAHMITRNITREAREALSFGDTVKLGHLLTLHHNQLRDGLDFLDEPVERVLHAASENGALGGKIILPGGQCIILSASERVEQIQVVLESMGATTKHVKIDREAISVEEYRQFAP